MKLASKISSLGCVLDDIGHDINPDYKRLTIPITAQLIGLYYLQFHVIIDCILQSAFSLRAFLQEECRKCGRNSFGSFLQGTSILDSNVKLYIDFRPSEIPSNYPVWEFTKPSVTRCWDT